MDAAASHLWQSTIFAAAAAVFTLMFRRNGAAVRYWIWFAAAIKFLIPFSILSALFHLVSLPPSTFAPDVVRASAALFTSSVHPNLSAPASTFLALVWLAGTIIFATRWACQWRSVAAQARLSEPITEGLVLDNVRRMEGALRLNKPIEVVSSGTILEPGVIGIINPVLLWPRHLSAALTDRHITAIVAHEVCHVARRDNLLAAAQIAVTAAFWFHPFVWWIGRQLVDERERACDERVVTLGLSPAVYADAIVKTCAVCLSSPVVNVAGVTGGKLNRRIVRIMQNAPALPLGPRKLALLMVAAVTVICAPAIGVADQNDQDREVHRPGGRVTAPKLIREVKPIYSERAKQEKIQGEVMMECVVKADGTAGDIKIVKPLDPDLDKAALDAAKQWVFEPGTRDGKPVDVLVTIAMAFTLK